MKCTSKIFLLILLCLTFVKPLYVQAGGGERASVDIGGTVTENVGTDNKKYPVNNNNSGSSERIKSDSRQFITFKTKDEKTFYLIIDHSKEQDNVKLLTDVKEADLESLINKNKEKEPVVKKEEPKVDIVDKEIDTKQEETKNKSPNKNKSSVGYYILLGGAIFLVLGIGYYFKVIKPKKDNNKYDEENEEDDDFFSKSDDEEDK